MHLQELKRKSPAELLNFAEDLQVENASALRRQDMMFAILKQLAENDTAIFGDGVLEILQDGFGFLEARRRTICLALTTSTSAPARCVVSGFGPAIRSKARSAHRRMASATSRC